MLKAFKKGQIENLQDFVVALIIIIIFLGILRFAVSESGVERDIREKDIELLLTEYTTNYLEQDVILDGRKVKMWEALVLGKEISFDDVVDDFLPLVDNFYSSRSEDLFSFEIERGDVEYLRSDSDSYLCHMNKPRDEYGSLGDFDVAVGGIYSSSLRYSSFGEEVSFTVNFCLRHGDYSG